ncbi:hypothetical protein D9M70_362640 [compost metagenome]
MQLGGQFDAGGAGADDGDADLVVGVLLGVGAQIVAEQLAVEAFGLFTGVEEDAVLGRALGAEIVGGAADRDHQAVVGQFACRHQFAPLLVVGGGQLDDLALAVEPAHAAELELEVVPLGLGHVIQLVLRGVERAGGHFVKQGFPDMGEVGVGQHDPGQAFLAEGSTQTGSELQAAGAAADDHDTMGHGKVSQGYRNSCSPMASAGGSS